MLNISREERQARVRQMQAEGRVMNDSLRRKIKAKAKRRTALEEKANLVLVGMKTKPNQERVIMGSAEPKVKEKAPEANVFLAGKVKEDKLASAAANIIKELQNG